MNNNRKKLLITIGVLLAITLLIGASYAYYIFAISQGGSNIVNTDCFRVTFTDGNAISLGDAIPLTDEEAEELIPYTFTIKNVCNHDMDYNINIETLDNTTMDLNAIKYQIYNDDYDYSDYLGSVLNNDPSTFINNNASNSKTIQSDYLIPNEEVTYNLKLWIGEDATFEQSANKTFSSKVVISSILRYENPPGALLAKGSIVNTRLKSLVGMNDYEMSENEIKQCNDLPIWSYSKETQNLCKYNDDYKVGIVYNNWSYALNHAVYIDADYWVGDIEFVNTPPDNNQETIVISDDISKDEIIAWAVPKEGEDGKYIKIIKIYSPSQIYLNRDSSFLFAGFNYLTNLDLNNVNFDFVENATGMFYYAASTILNFGDNFNAPRLKNMSGFFSKSNFDNILNLEKVNTSKVTNMSHMFDEIVGYESEDYKKLDTSHAKDVSYMFANTGSKYFDMSGSFIESFDLSSAQNMEGFLMNSIIDNLDISKINVSNATNLSRMFDNTNMGEIDVSTFDTSKVTDMSYMFANCKNLNSITFGNSFDTSNVTNMEGMFARSFYLRNIDVSNFNTSKVTNMKYMFSNETDEYHTETVSTSGKRLTGIQNFDTSNVTNMKGMFRGWETSIELPVSNFNTSKVTDMSFMFAGMNNPNNIDVSNFDTSNVTNMSYMFANNKFTTLDISNFDTSNVTDMSYMFSWLNNVTSLDVSHFNTSKVTNMTSMFCGMAKLTSLDVSHFNTSNVTNMSAMFEELNKLTSLDVSHFDTSNVTNMEEMFSSMEKIVTLDLSNFNTSKVTDMNNMFSYMSELQSINLGSFDTSKVTNMKYMFIGLEAISSLNLSNFDTSNVTDMSGMFCGSKGLTILDISNFDTRKVKKMPDIFARATNITTIYVGNNWSVSALEDDDNDTGDRNMFGGLTKIVGGAGTTFDTNHVNAEYARIDDPTNGKPGYLTLKTN